MTLRQLHYAIFSRAEIPYRNDMAHYKKLSRVTTQARRSFREAEIGGLESPELSIPSKWMVDETREGETVTVWRDVGEYLDAVKTSYRRDRWQAQRYLCEVWSEKATILAAIRPVAQTLGITLRVCHGFASTGMEQHVGSLFAACEKDIVVYFLGDHDPSGRVIERDIHKRVEVAAGREFHLERLAIHEDDIRKFDLPPQSIKASDSRSASFVAKYGAGAATVELDALPAVELRDRVEAAIVELIDQRAWNRQVQAEDEERQHINRFAEQFQTLVSQQTGELG
jgi:hypothetical protein